MPTPKKEIKSKKVVVKKTPVKKPKEGVNSPAVVEKGEASKKLKKLPYLYAVGRRKTSTARVRFYAKDSRTGFLINQKDYREYFPYFEFQQIVEAPLKKLDLLGKNYITVKVEGGGTRGQAEAVRHGLGRVLLKMDETLRKTLRGEGFLTRDSRKKERKKPGLKRARRAPQWSKR